MLIRKLLIVVLICLIIAASVSLVLLKSYRTAQHELALALSLLNENKIDQAYMAFTRLEESFWVRNHARLGRIITAVLTHRDHTSIPQPGKEDMHTVHIDRYHLPSLLKKQFRSANFDTCAALAQIGRFYKVEAADIYYAAALLEKGETELAFQLYSRLPHRLKSTFMGTRVKQTLEFLRAGARKIVRDHRGELIGFIDDHREFTFYRPQYRAYIQPVVLKEILNSADTPRGFRLSIDLELSRTALEALGENRGSIVLVKPGTGEILAAVSDEQTVKAGGEGASPAFEQMLEPASILKLVTITAAYRSGLNPDEEIRGKKCRGAKRYSGKFLYCPAAQGELYGLDHALAVSCNTSFADLGVAVGWEKMLAELRLFGFDSQKENPFPFGRIIIDRGDDRALADLAIGLENTRITPVHAAFIAAVFAADGTWVNPELISARDGFTGLCPVAMERVRGISGGVRILNEGWLPAIRNAMWAVTRYGGTAAFIAPIGFQVYMKTGTGGNARDGFHINYIGYSPGDRRGIAFCVRVTGKRTSSRIRRAGYAVNKELLIRLKRIALRGGI